MACALLFGSAFAGPANAAEHVEIVWSGNYPHNKNAVWDKRKDTLDHANIIAGWTKYFKAGTPQEFDTVEREGVLSAKLFRVSDQPTPFVVWMHGCTGLPTVVREWTEELAQLLNSQGVGLLVLDSLTRRRANPTCGNPDPHWGRRRADDAGSALDYLIDNKFAKRDAVYISGQSNGGLASLMAVTERMLDRKHRFAAAIAMEPTCLSVRQERFYAPILFILAEKDDGKDGLRAPPCIEVAKIRKKQPMQVLVVKGAYHGYMFKQKPGVSQYGWTVGYDDVAKRVLMNKFSEFMKNPKIVSRIDYQ